MNKRRIIRFITVLIIAAVLLVTAFLVNKKSTPTASNTEFIMDTYVYETLYGADSSTAFEYIKTLDNNLSAYNENSEIYKLNRDSQAVVSDDTALLIKEALQLTTDTNGLFDLSLFPITSLWNIGKDNARVPTDAEIQNALQLVGASNVKLSGNSVYLTENAGLDLGGIAKGFACDRVCEMYSQNPDITGAVLSFGSSILLYGSPDGEENFSVAIKNPESSNGTVGTLKISEGFISTSGSYERNSLIDGKTYSHIFDPKTGAPIESEFLSVTIIAPSGVLSDALSTAVFVGGEKSLSIIPDTCSYIIIDKEKKIRISKSLPASFSLTDSNYEVIYE